MNQLTRRKFIGSAGAMAGLVLGGCATRRKGFPAILTKSTDRHPNILFFFPDQHRYDWLGTTPEIPVQTPNIDALGTRGIRFTNAVCGSPLCAPSRACLASGMEYDNCGVSSNKINYPLTQPTYYQLLRDSGYHVIGCGKFDLHKPDLDWGIDGKRLIDKWGFSDGIDNAGKYDAIRSGADIPKDPYMAFLHEHGLADTHVQDIRNRHGYKSTEPTPLPDAAYCDNWIAANGLRLLHQSPPEKPWHLVVNFAGPHNPMDVTKTMQAWYRDVEFPQPNRNTQFTKEDHINIRRNYSAMVENIDFWLGVYIEELKRSGEYENTLIVYSSDHGEMLGDHDLWGKQKPYQPSASVPLVASGPDIARGLVSDAPVTTVDLAATFLDYANLPIPDFMESRSMRNLWRGKQKKQRDIVRSGLKEWRLAFDGRYKLIAGYGETDRPLLFDLQNDPNENHDISRKNPTAVNRLSEYL